MHLEVHGGNYTLRCEVKRAANAELASSLVW